MTNFTFTRDIPATPNDPSNDQPPMKINTNSIDSILLLDHFGFNDNLGGYHNIIHQPNQLADPVNITIPPINQTYAKSYTPDTTGGVADTELFIRTAVGQISQLTGRLSGAANGTDGWVWSGGILFQWGTVLNNFSSGSTTSTVTFKDRVAGAIPFPNFCFNVQATPLVSFASLPSSAASISIRQSSLSKTAFQWQFYSNSSQYTGFFWYAIGI